MIQLEEYRHGWRVAMNLSLATVKLLTVPIKIIDNNGNWMKLIMAYFVAGVASMTIWKDCIAVATTWRVKTVPAVGLRSFDWLRLRIIQRAVRQLTYGYANDINRNWPTFCP